MKYDPDKHHRRSIRLKGYDYSSTGAYFVTICTQNRACLFGEIWDGVMHLNDAGKMIDRVWHELPHRFLSVELDAFIVMPNHIHGIIRLTDNAIMGNDDNCVGVPLVGTLPTDPGTIADSGEKAGTRPAPTGEHENPVGVPLVGTPNPEVTLGEIVGTFKSISTHEYAIAVKQQNWQPFYVRLWQRNYYEHVIRDAIAFEKILDYVQTNPRRWHLDQLHPENPSKW